MKTSEFKKRIEELGFELGDNCGEDDVYVYKNKNDGKLFVELGLRDDYIYLNNNLKDLGKKLRYKLVTLCTDYVSTPIEERKDEEKYYWKIRNPYYQASGAIYLHVYEQGLSWYIGIGGSPIIYDTQFTEREYKQMVEDGFIPDIFEKEEIC